jgi:hypothetical protein
VKQNSQENQCLGNTINYSSASKPFIVTSVILLFIGSSIGSIWMMSIFGTGPPQWFHDVFQLHKMLQMDGFLTLLIMGIGYMIVPRFRNIHLVSTKLAYVSFLLVLASLVFQLIQTIGYDKNLSVWIMIPRIFGIVIFLIIIFWTLRVRPKLLGLSDYFVTLCLVSLMSVNVIDLLGYGYTNSLTHIQLWLLFPVLMIFGIEYKTLPSFLGFIRPRKNLAITSLFFISSSIISGLASVLFMDMSLLFSIIFNVTLFASALTFASAVYAFGGFDNSEILSLIKGEKKARYNFTVIHIKISFLFLFIGISIAIFFILVGHYFVFYDLVIHSIAIGFIGLTIALYLPLMLPPIIGKIIHFTNFNRIPLILIIISLSIRTVGDFILAQPSSPSSFSLGYIRSSMPQIFTHFFGLSGWLIVTAMLVFVIMIHKSTKGIDALPRNNTNTL